MMTATDAQKYQQVVERIAPHSRLIEQWSLHGGISAEMTAVAFARPDGRVETVIVRRPGMQTNQQNPLAAENEYRVLQVTRSLGLATPAPLFFDPSGRIFPDPYLVIAYIDGRPEFAPPDAARYAAQMAEHLARIHSADCTALDCAFLPKPSAGCAELPRRWTANVDPAFAVQRVGDALASRLPIPRRNAPALLHGDFWPGNLLWRDGNLAAVIDWEDAQLGDPLLDLAISRLDICWIFGTGAMDTFTRQYLSQTAIDPTALPWWDACAALRLARLAGANLEEWAAFFHPYGREDITGQSIRAQVQTFVHRALAAMA